MQLFAKLPQQQPHATNNTTDMTTMMMTMNSNNMLNATMMLPGNNNNNFVTKYTVPSAPHHMTGFNDLGMPHQPPHITQSSMLLRMHQQQHYHNHHIPLHHQPNNSNNNSNNHHHQRPRRRRSNNSLVASMDPEAVARRNERERNRVKQVNDGFDALRKKVPFLPDKKKLSKVEILRCAMMYIRDLKGVVEEFDHNNTHFAPQLFNINTRPDGSLSSTSSDDDFILLEQDIEDDLLTC